MHHPHGLCAALTERDQKLHGFNVREHGVIDKHCARTHGLRRFAFRAAAKSDLTLTESCGMTLSES